MTQERNNAMKGCTGLLKERVRRKDVLITGCIMDSRSGVVVEMYHESGYDVLMIDREQIKAIKAAVAT